MDRPQIRQGSIDERQRRTDVQSIRRFPTIGPHALVQLAADPSSSIRVPIPGQRRPSRRTSPRLGSGDHGEPGASDSGAETSAKRDDGRQEHQRGCTSTGPTTCERKRKTDERRGGPVTSADQEARVTRPSTPAGAGTALRTCSCAAAPGGTTLPRSILTRPWIQIQVRR